MPQKYGFFRGMRLEGFKCPKIKRATARDSFPCLPAFCSSMAIFIVKVNKKFSICKLLQKEAKIMRACAWIHAPALVRA